jgi:hypothetical protein
VWGDVVAVDVILEAVEILITLKLSLATSRLLVT